MRGKRKLQKIEVLSTNAEQVYECDCCAWLLHVAGDVGLSAIQAEFDSHDCKFNSLKNRASSKNNR